MIKIVRVRFCDQCGDPLAKKCKNCLKHPERKLKVVELYDFPTPLKVAECGCCILLQCQRPGCSNTFWRYIKLRGKEKKSRARNFVCGTTCAAAVANSCKAQKVAVSCSYCGKVKQIQPSVFKLRRHFFCSSEHHYLWQQKQSAEAIKQDERRAMVECPHCKVIVECEETSKVYFGNAGAYRCLPSGHVFKINGKDPAEAISRPHSLVAA